MKAKDYLEAVSCPCFLPVGGGPTHLPTPPPRPPFSAPKYGRGGGAGLGTGEGLNSVPSQSQGLLGSTDTYTDLRGRRGLTSFCFSPRPKGNRKMVSGQGKRTTTRGTWADTGSGHVMAARHRQAQIPSYHFDRRRCCRNQPIFPDPLTHHTSSSLTSLFIFAFSWLLEAVSIQS